MPVQPPAPNPAARPPTARRGFSFIEVLFAVMILGIGFIMIAGIFPVAISQTAATQEETIASAAVRGAAGAIQNIPYRSQLIPATGEVVRFTDDAATIVVGGVSSSVSPWSYFKGNQVIAQDPRYAWVALVKRDAQDYLGQVPTTAQVIVIPVHVRGRSNFDRSDVVQTNTGVNARAALMPHFVRVTLKDNGNLPDTVTIDPASPGAGAAAPGAVVVMRTGLDSSLPIARPMAGRAYRLGNPVEGVPNQYELLPGNDLPGPNEEPKANPAEAWIVGQGYAPGTTTFGEGNLAIGVFHTYINLK